MQEIFTSEGSTKEVLMKPAIYQLFVPNGLHNHPGRLLTKIGAITIHTTGNHNLSATAEAHARFQFTGGGSRQASWHYTVDATEIWQSFRDEQMCWHTGTRAGNEISIGIEICVNNRENFKAAVNRSARLTAFLLKQHGLNLDDVVQHHKWSGKNCPAELRGNTWGVNWEDFLAMVKEYLGNEATVLSDGEAEAVIDSLANAGITFHNEHWQGVLTGTIRPNREWTKTLTNRIIDNRWSKFSPAVIGSSIMALLGQKNP